MKLAQKLIVALGLLGSAVLATPAQAHEYWGCHPYHHHHYYYGCYHPYHCYIEYRCHPHYYHHYYHHYHCWR